MPASFLEHVEPSGPQTDHDSFSKHKKILIYEASPASQLTLFSLEYPSTNLTPIATLKMRFIVRAGALFEVCQ